MRHRREGFGAGETGPRRVEYAWRHAGRWQRLTAEAEGEPQPLVAGSHQQFIAEHYWGYCRQSDGGTIEYSVEHPPWRVWRATGAALDCDAESLYGPAIAMYFPGRPTQRSLPMALRWPCIDRRESFSSPSVALSDVLAHALAGVYVLGAAIAGAPAIEQPL